MSIDISGKISGIPALGLEYYKTNHSFDESLLKHILPLNWEHINLLGEYRFDTNDIPKEDEFRPLNISEA